MTGRRPFHHHARFGIGIAVAVLAGLMVSAPAAAQSWSLLTNGTFDGTTIAPWQAQVNLCQGMPCPTTLEASVVNGQMDLIVQDGYVSTYDGQVGQVLTGPIVTGHRYYVGFWARAIDAVASAPGSLGYPLSLQISNMGNIDFETGVSLPDLDPTTGESGKMFNFSFVADHADAAPWLGFFMGGQHERAELMFDNFVVWDTTLMPIGGDGGSNGNGGTDGAGGAGGDGGASGIGGASGDGGSAGSGGMSGSGGAIGSGGIKGSGGSSAGGSMAAGGASAGGGAGSNNATDGGTGGSAAHAKSEGCSIAGTGSPAALGPAALFALLIYRRRRRRRLARK